MTTYVKQTGLKLRSYTETYSDKNIKSENKDISKLPMNYELRRENIETLVLRERREQLIMHQEQLETEEKGLILNQLPELTQTRLMLERLQAKAKNQPNMKKSLRAQYAVQYDRLQTKYNLQVNEYNKNLQDFDIKSTLLRREIDAFNMDVDRHNQQLIDDENHVESYDPERD